MTSSGSSLTGCRSVTSRRCVATGRRPCVLPGTSRPAYHRAHKFGPSFTARTAHAPVRRTAAGGKVEGAHEPVARTARLPQQRRSKVRACVDAQASRVPLLVPASQGGERLCWMARSNGSPTSPPSVQRKRRIANCHAAPVALLINALLHELGVAENGREQGSELMAHVGDELRLRCHPRARGRRRARTPPMRPLENAQASARSRPSFDLARPHVPQALTM